MFPTKFLCCFSLRGGALFTAWANVFLIPLVILRNVCLLISPPNYDNELLKTGRINTFELEIYKTVQSEAYHEQLETFNSMHPTKGKKFPTLKSFPILIIFCCSFHIVRYRLCDDFVDFFIVVHSWRIRAKTSKITAIRSGSLHQYRLHFCIHLVKWIFIRIICPPFNVLRCHFCSFGFIHCFEYSCILQES